ncbi:hypothetical protein QQ045_017260 [Rhodiola kirilowii]
MNRSDFGFSEASELNPNFGVSSSTGGRSGYGRTRPRLTKLRKPKSSFLEKGADSGYNPFRNDVIEGGRGKVSSVFGWSSNEGSAAGGRERVGLDDGSTNDNLNFSVGRTDDTEYGTELLNGFERLNVRENAAPGSGGGSFTSYFEFRSSENGRLSAGVLPEQLRNLNLDDSARDAKGKHKSDNFGDGGIRSSFSDLNGSAEAMLSEKLENVRIRDGVRVSDTNAAGNSSSHENLKNGTNHEHEENMFFRGAGISVPTASQIPAIQPTNLANGGSGLSSLRDPTSCSSSTTFTCQHEASFFQENVGNRHIGEGFYFTGKMDGAATPIGNSSLNRKVRLVPKRHAGKNSNLKKKKENLKDNMESLVEPAVTRQESVSKDFSAQPESPQQYSPMDMSPYSEIVVDNQHSNEAPMTSEEPLIQGDGSQSSEGNTKNGNHPLVEDFAYATQNLNIGEVCINSSRTNINDSEACASERIGEISPEAEGCASGTETESFKSAPDKLDFNTDNSISAATKLCSPSNSGSEGTTDFYSFCNSESTGGTKFTFTASTSSQGPASVRPYKKINRRKGFDSYRSTATSKPSNALSGGQQPEDSLQNSVNANLTGSQPKEEMKSSTSVRKEVNNESSGTHAATNVAREACEKWRLRGNQAYANGDPSKAEEYYTRGVNCIPKSENFHSCHKALMLCYSNRAATRMSLGRLREAVEDCKLAAGIDPSFLKAHVRAANCFLALGEIEEASSHFKYCLQSRVGVPVDSKILTDASEGLQKAQKATECMSRSIEFIQRGTYSDAESALMLADEALTISLYSDKLLEIKAEALFLLQKYSEVIQLCQGSLDYAERNSNIAAVVIDRLETSHNALLHGRLYCRLWRCHLMLKSYFFLGKLEDALSVLEGHESLRMGSETLESMIPFVAIVRELLRYKVAGNEAFQSGKYSEAIEHYTAAILFNVDSRPFAAICFCNRAAAYKALGKTVDAIADCNMAIALESDYYKAISRRASLYESIRDYGQAARDMEKIVFLLMEQADASHLSISHEKPTKSGIPIGLRQARLQLARLEEQARMDIPLDFYLILGIESSASAAEIKKAYRQAALKHHPDKAGQILAKGDTAGNGTWKEIAEEIHRHADRLFKLIGEAYTILSDPAQRSRYDAEEEYRELLKKNSERFTSRTNDDACNYPFQSSRSGRQWNNVWRSYGQ